MCLITILAAVALCLQAGAKVMVDGAHALGSLPQLDIPAVRAHFYAANLHKWMCAPKGAALLYVEPAEQALVRPVVVSHGYRLGFRGEFFWQGKPCEVFDQTNAGEKMQGW